jgi:class 3 adenylate cyclase
MRPDLPTGVVTLVFTDIEGSTRLLAELRGGYIDALAEHRRVIREAVAPHGAGGALNSGPRDQTRPTACRR